MNVETFCRQYTLQERQLLSDTIVREFGSARRPIFKSSLNIDHMVARSHDDRNVAEREKCWVKEVSNDLMQSNTIQGYVHIFVADS